MNSYYHHRCRDNNNIIIIFHMSIDLISVVSLSDKSNQIKSNLFSSNRSFIRPGEDKLLTEMLDMQFLNCLFCEYYIVIS